MNRKQSRAVLLGALLISLLLHFFLAGFLRWSFSPRQEESTVAKVRVTRIARVVPHTPPPTPAPNPLHTPRAVASIAPPVVTHTGPGPALPRVARVPAPPSTAFTPAPPSATPAASATPGGPCGGHADEAPSAATTPGPIDLPAQARASKVSGTAAVHVSLDAQGNVVDAQVARSSGNAGLDAAAVQMARSATYTPKYLNCRAVAGDYTFTVKFVAW